MAETMAASPSRLAVMTTVSPTANDALAFDTSRMP